MKYNIFKDKRTVDTVKKIKKILKNKLGLPLSETLFFNKEVSYIQPFSLRVNVPDFFNIGTNGKGTSLDNAKASGYAEFLERLQNQTFISGISDEFLFAPDEIIQEDISEIKNNIFFSYFKDFKLIEQLNKIANNLVDNSNLHKNRIKLTENNLFLLPFFNIKNKEVYNLPYKIIRLLQLTTGMASGNTKEEALVQGLSEICERYVLKEMFINKISLPDIPEKYYMEYDTIKDLINYYKNLGYILHIKDASLNKNIPTICIIIEDADNKIFNISLGSHPSLPVAIERTLTEFSQGIAIKDKKQALYKEDELYSVTNDNTETLIELLSMKKIQFKYDNNKKFGFLSDKPKYEFSPISWVQPNKKYSNKNLLNFLLDRIEPITKNDIFIRDVSFLGFPAFYIFIPTMSILYNYTEQDAHDEINLINWIDFPNNSQQYKLSTENLLEALEYKRQNRISIWRGNISSIPSSHIALLCSVLLKDRERINFYINKTMQTLLESKSDNITRLKIMNDFYNADFNTNEPECTEYLSKKYTIQDVNNFYEFNNRLSFEVIKKLIATHKLKNDNSDNEKILILRKKLGQEYKKNKPNQQKLEKIFRKF